MVIIYYYYWDRTRSLTPCVCHVHTDQTVYQGKSLLLRESISYNPLARPTHTPGVVSVLRRPSWSWKNRIAAVVSPTLAQAAWVLPARADSTPPSQVYHKHGDQAHWSLSQSWRSSSLKFITIVAIKLTKVYHNHGDQAHWSLSQSWRSRWFVGVANAL